jgi:shikimate dehydrogenase
VSKYGLIGKDIKYSQSPTIQKAIANVHGYDINYDLIDIDHHEIPFYMDAIRTGHIQGLNVTKPYKLEVMQYLDACTDIAKRIGAVNTIYLKDNKLIGDNTDYDGFKKSLDLYDINVKDQKVFILGTGGAARACYHVLSDLKASVYVVSRRKDDILEFPNVLSFDDINNQNPYMIINTTYVGLDLFKDYNIKPNKKTIMYDVNYKPDVTPMMTYVDHAYNGLSMLILQAIKSQSIWLSKTLKTDLKTINQIKEAAMHE